MGRREYAEAPPGPDARDGLNLSLKCSAHPSSPPGFGAGPSAIRLKLAPTLGGSIQGPTGTVQRGRIESDTSVTRTERTQRSLHHEPSDHRYDPHELEIRRSQPT